MALIPSLCARGSHSAPLDLSVTSGEILVPIPYGCFLKDEISRRKKTKLTFIVGRVLLVAWVSPGSLSEMQSPRPHPDLLNQDLDANKIPRPPAPQDNPVHVKLGGSSALHTFSHFVLKTTPTPTFVM